MEMKPEVYPGSHGLDCGFKRSCSSRRKQEAKDLLGEELWEEFCADFSGGVRRSCREDTAASGDAVKVRVSVEQRIRCVESHFGTEDGPGGGYLDVIQKGVPGGVAKIRK